MRITMMKILTLLMPALFLACGQAANPEKAPSGNPAPETTETSAAAPADQTQSPAATTTGANAQEPSSESVRQPEGPKASLTATYWAVVELNGKNVSGTTAKEMHLTFDPSSPQFKGHTGCNTVFGEFKTGAAGRISFLGIIPTSMDCQTADVEAAFLQALEEVNTYAINGNTLTLSKQKMAPALVLIAKR